MKQTLERLTPETERPPYWDGVLRDARPSRARLAAPRLAIVAAVLGVAAFIAIAPWKTGERAGVLERALAAVGDGPVTHLVLRDEWGGTLVDLETGQRDPLYNERELWIDPDRGFVQIARFDGTVQYRSVASPANVEKPIGILASGYREALDSGRARLAGPGIIENTPVYWIQVRREVLRDVGDGKDHVWAQEVAVDRDSYDPVYVRETRDGKPGEFTGSRVLLAEHLPAGSGDFTPSPKGPGPGIMFGASPDPIASAEASAILGGKTAWLGEVFDGLELTKIAKLTMKSGYSSETGRWAEELEGVQLQYGPEWLGITIQQAPRSHVALERGIGKYRVPEGHVALTPIGYAFLNYQGTFVALRAANEKVALAAARALRPLSAGNGAGG